MIGNALDFVVQQLNDFIFRKTGTRKKMVKLSSLVNLEGNTSPSHENTLVISVVNIAEEGILANHYAMRRQNGEFLKQSPAVHLNVYMLVSSVFSEGDYQTGLSWLSLVISFFQQHSNFDPAVQKLPGGIDKLSFELVNLDVDNMSRFWGALGARYQPSVLYKMRMLTIDSNVFVAKYPELNNPQVGVKTK